MTEIVSPFQQFFDTTGAPLANGMIYIGTANLDAESNPIAVFWDEALTIPAAQPIRTLNGYPAWNGAPARLYISQNDFSITVRNAQGRSIFALLYVNGLSTLNEAINNLRDELNANIDQVETNLAAASGSSLIGYQSLGVGAITTRTVQDKLREPYLSVADFGAIGDNTTSCDAAVAAAFTAAKAQRKRLHFPAGTYLFTTSGTTFWNLAGNEIFGMMITGEGAGNTILRFPNVTSQIALQIYASSDWYDFVMSDLQIQAQTSTAAVVIGQNSFVDPLNMGNFTNVVILNTLNNSNAEGLRLNYVINSNFIGVRANCFADGLGGNKGTGLRARQAAFNTFVNGSYGNGTYGVRFTDGFSFGNVFLGCDHENVDYCIKNDSASSGNNTWVGGQLSLWTVAALSASGGLGTNTMTLLNPNFSNGASPAPRIDPSNFGGIRLIDGNLISTPSLPASGVTSANITGKRVLVTFWAGSVTSVSVNGFGIGIAGSGSVVVPHGQTIALTYTGSPAWLWQALE